MIQTTAVYAWVIRFVVFFLYEHRLFPFGHSLTGSLKRIKPLMHWIEACCIGIMIPMES